MRFPCTLVIAFVMGLSSGAHAYTTNGRVWPEMPIVLHVNPTGAPPMEGGLTAVELVERAAQAWADVRCTSVSFEVIEDPTAGWAADGKNSIFWMADDWIFNENAAGATLTLPTAPGAIPEVDIALNAAELAWLLGGGDALAQGVVAPGSVLTHEIGHLLGLSHASDVHATMYHALLPNGVQASLDSDDRLGICSLYPNGEPDCVTDQDCPDGGECTAQSAAAARCEWPRAQAGEPCNKTDLRCEGLCVVSYYECTQVCAFTSADYSTGYCAPLCQPRSFCPEAWECTETEEVSVCTAPGPALPTTDWIHTAVDSRTLPLAELVHDAGEWSVASDGTPTLVETPASVESDSTPSPATAPPPSETVDGAEDPTRSGCRASRGPLGRGFLFGCIVVLAAFHRRRPPRDCRRRGG